ncbi:MAG: putative DNA modification/repair radical SAM protein [Clostridia bacterium]|nr:putative DNA modification/repair radical SAM protein [Clostridia bacterium]
MTTQQKLEILGAAAKYDASCASSGLNRAGKSGSVGCTTSAGICHAWTEDGRCISLLKVLLTNHCIYDCAYCPNGCSHDVPRAAFQPRELAELTVEFYKRNYVEGLFLSSGVVKSPDYTVELLIRTLKILREEYRFRGYVHAKVIPGTDERLIEELGRLADRVSVNVEFASKRSMALLAANKDHRHILPPMKYISQRVEENRGVSWRGKKQVAFAPAGQSTQLIVGATPERDLLLMRLAEGLYGGYGMKRVYYSAYIPVVSNPLLPALGFQPPKLREHRLYQADWLLRFYGFQVQDLLNEAHQDLPLQYDPKVDYALRHRELFPVEIGTADYEMLLRVPGIGVQSAGRIVAARRYGIPDEQALRKMGVVWKRAAYFITCNGKFYGRLSTDHALLEQVMVEPRALVQPSLFDGGFDGGEKARDSAHYSAMPLLGEPA